MGCEQSADAHHHEKGCCPPGSWPALQFDYKPLGEMYKVDNIPVYHVGTGSKDIFGIQSGRHKSCADTYASMGYNVFMPQLLDSPHVGPIHDVPKIIETCKKPEHQISKLIAKYKKVDKDLQSKGFKKYFVVGFCYGMWIAFHLATELDSFICIAAMHPSLFVENLFGRNELDLVAKMKSPAFLYSGSNDAENVKKGGAVTKKLEQMFGASKTGVEQFPQMQHGWVIRGDLKEANVKRDVEKTIKMSDEYFKRFA